jgi:hypothetical protein
MNHQIFGDYLRHLRAQMPNGDHIFLVCDVHASHRIQDVKELAAELNIELLDIPPGATDTLQPLDRKVFGVLKSETRRLFRQHASGNPELKRRKSDAVQDVLEAWNGLSDAILHSAWLLYEEDGADDWEGGF